VAGTPQPVTAEGLAHYATVSAKYGYWNATPDSKCAKNVDN